MSIDPRYPRLRRYLELNRTRWLGVLGVGWLAVVALLTLAPAAPSAAPLEQIDPLCLICGSRGTSDAILNTILFLPFGFLMTSAGVPLRWVLAIALAGTGLIEVSQSLIPNRTATLGDVLWNVAGAGLGGVARSALPRALAAIGEGLRGPGAWATLLPAACLVAAGWLLAPLGTAVPYWGQWTPDLGHLEPYGGELLDARLNGRTLPRGRFPPDWEVRRELTGDWIITALATKGASPRELAPVVSIYDGNQREIALLGVSGEDLVWRERLRAGKLRMDQPELRVDAALGNAAPGDTLEVTARRVRRDRCLAVDEREWCGLGFTPGSTWALLYPAPNGPAGRLLDALWLALLFSPVGIFSSHVRRLAVHAAVSIGLMALAILGTRLVGTPPTELLAIVAGLVAGRAARPVLIALCAERR